LARFDDNDLLADFIKRENINGDKTETTEADNQIKSAEVDARIDPYSEKYSYESCARFEIPSESTTVKDYLKSCREKLLDEIKRVNEEILTSMESEELTVDRDRKDDEYMEELKSQIFDKRFCFLLDLQDTRRKNDLFTEFKYLNNCLFSLTLVVTDFYMNPEETDLISK